MGYDYTITVYVYGLNTTGDHMVWLYMNIKCLGFALLLIHRYMIFHLVAVWCKKNWGREELLRTTVPMFAQVCFLCCELYFL